MSTWPSTPELALTIVGVAVAFALAVILCDARRQSLGVSTSDARALPRSRKEKRMLLAAAVAVAILAALVVLVSRHERKTSDFRAKVVFEHACRRAEVAAACVRAVPKDDAELLERIEKSRQKVASALSPAVIR